MTEFRMPSLGADMDFGRVVQWRVKPGDIVRRGDIIVEVETDKGTFDVESPVEGPITQILVQTGAKVPVGTVLASLGAEAPAAAEPERQRVSPAARKLAEEKHVDLSHVHGTGPGDVITIADIERAAAVPTPPSAAPAPAPSVDTAAPQEARANMRKAIAAAVTRSKREIPHYYLSTDIDLSRALRWMEDENRQRPVVDRLLPSALTIRATGVALTRHPHLNGFYVDGQFRPGSGVHVGVAVSLRSGGLVAPAIHDVDRKTVSEVMAALRDLVTRARGGGLRGSEMTDATITVTSLGDQGVTTVIGVIYPPQVAIVGFGKVTERAWAVDGSVAARPVVTVTLAADHRVTDGHYGGLFLAEIDRLLQAPETL
jgi:pyruvate dehydrogenase E2 component (dihydrolipoamide acetyltransferase)